MWPLSHLAVWTPRSVEDAGPACFDRSALSSSPLTCKEGTHLPFHWVLFLHLLWISFTPHWGAHCPTNSCPLHRTDWWPQMWIMDPTNRSTISSLEGNKEHPITNVLKSPYTASSAIHIIVRHFTASQNHSLHCVGREFKAHSVPLPGTGKGMPSTTPGCSEHCPAWPGIYFIMFLFPQKHDLSLKNTLPPAKTHHVTMTHRQQFTLRGSSQYNSLHVNTGGEKSQKEEFLLLQIP